MKTLKTFSNLAEAGFASSLLEAAGIPTFLADEQSSQWSLGMAIPIRLQVEEAHFDRARDVLEKGLQASEVAPLPEIAALGPACGDGRVPFGPFLAVGAFFALLAFAIHQTREDRNPRLAREQTDEYDRNQDGRPDYFDIYTRNRIIRSEGDRNFDGRMDHWFFYDKDGMATRGEFDDNFDGRPDAWVTYRHGLEAAIKEDNDFNGKIDRITTYTHGVRVRAEARPNESEIVVHEQLFRSGVLYEERVDQDQDGKFDYKILYDPYHTPSDRMPLGE